MRVTSAASVLDLNVTTVEDTPFLIVDSYVSTPLMRAISFSTGFVIRSSTVSGGAHGYAMETIAFPIFTSGFDSRGRVFSARNHATKIAIRIRSITRVRERNALYHHFPSPGSYSICSMES